MLSPGLLGLPRVTPTPSRPLSRSARVHGAGSSLPSQGVHSAFFIDTPSRTYSVSNDVRQSLVLLFPHSLCFLSPPFAIESPPDMWGGLLSYQAQGSIGNAAGASHLIASGLLIFWKLITSSLHWEARECRRTHNLDISLWPRGHRPGFAQKKTRPHPMTRIIPVHVNISAP